MIDFVKNVCDGTLSITIIVTLVLEIMCCCDEGDSTHIIDVQTVC